MKKTVQLLFLLLFASALLINCKAMAKAAVKYWTKQQIKEFKANCNDKVRNNKLIPNASDFCDCASGTLMEKFHNYEDVKTLGVVDLIREAKDCTKK